MFNSRVFFIAACLTVLTAETGFSAIRDQDRQNVSETGLPLDPKNDAHVRAWKNASPAQRRDYGYYEALGHLPARGGVGHGAGHVGMTFNPKVMGFSAAYDAKVQLIKQHLVDVRVDVTKSYNVTTGILFFDEKKTYPTSKQEFIDYQNQISSAFFRGCLAFITQYKGVENPAELLGLLALDITPSLPAAAGLNEDIIGELLQYATTRMGTSLSVANTRSLTIRGIFARLGQYKTTIEQLIAFDGQIRASGAISDKTMDAIGALWVAGIKAIGHKLSQTPVDEKIGYPEGSVIKENAKINGSDQDRQRVVKQAAVKLLNTARTEGISDLVSRINRKMYVIPGARAGGDKARDAEALTSIIRALTSKSKTLQVFVLDLFFQSKVAILKEFASRNLASVLFGNFETTPDFRLPTKAEVVMLIALVDNLTNYDIVRNPPRAGSAPHAAAGGHPQADARSDASNDKATREEELRQDRERRAAAFAEARRKIPTGFAHGAGRGRFGGHGGHNG